METGFHWWEGVVAGAAATVVMTLLMQMGSAMGMTRMSMFVMLGSMFRRNAREAKRVGLVLHLMNGLVFGLVYALVWWAFSPELSNAWWIGLVFGAVHGLVLMVMMPLMSAMHPRVSHGTLGRTPADEVRLPPFGLGGTGFGSMTPLGIMMGHLVFGIVWGLVFWAVV